jgi:hypothetical protein
VDCIECHETGGPVAAATFGLVPRSLHIVMQMTGLKLRDGYAHTVSSAACLECHSTQMTHTLTVEAQGVRVSHKEPIAAGADCTDCHRLTSGTVSNTTVGMTPCLTCHDGVKAKAQCTYCHTKDIATAARPNSGTKMVGQDLIATPDCYACHQPQTCDACHGIRMPHTQEFMKHGHARIAAQDFWFGTGKLCFKCHTATRNPCTKCHLAAMPSHGAGLTWAKGHQYGDPVNCSSSCHGYLTGHGSRSICAFCHDGNIKPKPQPKVAPIP